MQAVQQVQTASQESEENRDLKGHKETKERKGMLVRGVRKVTVALLDFRASQEQLERQETLAREESSDQVVKEDLLDLLDLLVKKVRWVLLDPVGLLELEAALEISDQRALMENLVFQARPVLLDLPLL